MSNKKKIIISIISVIVLVILVVAVFIVKQPHEAPNVYASIADGSKAMCIRGGYTWNYIGGTVVSDSIKPIEFEYGNENTILVKPGEQITFSNSGIDFTSHKFYAEKIRYYDKNNNEVEVQVEESSIYRDLKHFTLKAPEDDGTYIYELYLNYNKKGEAIYGLKVVVSSDPTYTISELIKYKDTYIGDASKVNSILAKLPYSKYKDGIVLRTAKEPYELIVRYKGISLEKSTLLNNSIALFTLINNLDIITYSIIDDTTSLVYTRSEVESLVGRELSEYANNTELWLQEVFYKEPFNEKGKLMDLYKIVISDAIGSINGLMNEYIAIDIESFNVENKLSNVEKRKILDYSASITDVVIESNIQELKDHGLYVDSLKGTLIRLKSINIIEDIYEIIIEKIKSDTNIEEIVYDAKLVDGDWTLIEK